MNHVGEFPDPIVRARAIGRLAFIAVIYRVSIVLLTNDPAHTEAWDYGTIAENVVAGKGYSGDAWYAAFGPTAFMAPLYPLLLAASKLATQSNPYLYVQIFQALAGALTVGFAYLLFRRHVPHRKAFLAAALIAFHPLIAYFCHVMLPSVFATMLIFAGLWQLDLAFAEPKIRRAAIVGLIVGLGALFEPTTLFAYPGFMAFYLMRNPRLILPRIAVIGVVAFATISPWLIRNAVVFHQFIPMKSNFGMNLWQGNNPDTNGSLHMDDGRSIMDALPAEQIATFRSMNEIEMDNWFRREALLFIRQNPARTAQLYVRKLLYFYNPYPPTPYRAINPGFDMGRFPLVRTLLNIIVFATALGGIAISVARRYRVMPLLLTLVAPPFLFAVFHLDNHRYRFPYDHVLLLFSAIFILQVRDLLLRRSQ